MSQTESRSFQIVFSESNSSQTRTYPHEGTLEDAIKVAREILGGAVRGQGWVRIDEETDSGLEEDVFNALAGA